VEPAPKPRLALLALACAATLVLLAGCSNDEEEAAPAACLAGSEAYLAALEAAPDEVRLEGGTPISECLTSAQEGGELAQIGQDMVVVATRLNREARENPGGPAPVQLGYLAGAVQRGAEGIHADLVRRINSAASFSPSGQPTGAFQQGFSQGYKAGSESG
jgi:hypothetical protein